YVCLARLEQAREQGDSLFEDERRAELDALAAWAGRTSDGSLADLTDEPTADVWDAVAAESDLCTRLKCPHFDRCFLFQARRRAALLSAASRDIVQQGVADALAAARRAADDVFTRLTRRLDGEQGPAPVLRLRDEFLSDAVWEEGLRVGLDNLLLAFSRLSEGV